jgi:hypothetical protein
MNVQQLLTFYSRPGIYNPLSINKDSIKSIEKIIYTHKNINVYCYVCFYNEQNKNKIINLLKHYINSTIDYIKPKLGSFKDNNLVILISLDSKKKEFLKTNIIQPTNVNNGLTSFLHDGTRHIFIYRMQDVYKVLIHEMIHYFDADFRGIKLKGISDKLALTFIENNGINYNEAFVEAMAIYLYCLFSKKEMNSIVERGMRVAKAILTQPDYVSKGRMYQNTNGYSYYICRAALLLNLPLLLAVYKSRNPTDFVNLINKSMIMFNNEIDKYKPLKSMQVILEN